MSPEQRDVVVVVTTVIVLGVVLVTAIIGITIVAVATERSLLRAELMTFGGVILLAALGGVSWATIRRRRRHWHVELERDNGDP